MFTRILIVHVLAADVDKQQGMMFRIDKGDQVLNVREDLTGLPD